MALQETVILNLVPALPGNVTYNPGFTRISPYFAGTPNAPAGASGLFFGGAAFKDASTLDHSSVLPGQTGLPAYLFAGFVARNAYTQNTLGGPLVVSNGTPVGVLDKGEIYVVADVAMAITDPVFLIINDVDTTKIGKLTTGPATADVIDISAYVTLKGYTTDADQIVKVSVSIS